MLSTRPRRLFGLGEWLTLAGMVAVVLGAGFEWPNPPPALIPVGAAYVSQRPHTALGYDLRLGPVSFGWVLVACAVACAALLLWEPGRARRPLAALQMVLGLAALGLTATRIGPYTGVVFSLIGAALLVGGAASRLGKESAKI